MCGRYVISDSSTQIATELMNEYDKEAFSEKLRESYNVAPTQQVPLVRERDGRELTTARWGFATSLAAANQKAAQMERTATNLGMPTIGSPPPARSRSAR